MPKYQVTIRTKPRKQKPTEKRADAACKFIAEGSYDEGFGPRHILLGLNKEAKVGDTIEIEGRIFEIPQAALWEKSPADAPAA